MFFEVENAISPPARLIWGWIWKFSKNDKIKKKIKKIKKKNLKELIKKLEKIKKF